MAEDWTTAPGAQRSPDLAPGREKDLVPPLTFHLGQRATPSRWPPTAGIPALSLAASQTARGRSGEQAQGRRFPDRRPELRNFIGRQSWLP